MDWLEEHARATRTQDAAEGRVFEWVAGVVKDTNDPSKLCRVRARIGAQWDGETSEWLMPLLPGAVESVPKTGDPVLVGFLHGDPNRGFYAATIDTRTTGRPTNFMLLGSSFLPLYNDLVGKFNALKSKYNQLQADVAALQTALDPGTFKYQAGGGTLTFSVTASQDNDADAAKGQAADGSTPAGSATAAKVLSGVAKVR